MNQNSHRFNLNFSKWIKYQRGKGVVTETQDQEQAQVEELSNQLKQSILENANNRPKSPMIVTNEEESLPELTQEEEDALDDMGDYTEICEKEFEHRYVPYNRRKQQTGSQHR